MRLLVSLAIATALVWVIPVAFIGRGQARRAERLGAGATDVTASPVTVAEVPSGSELGPAPTGPIARANDLAAQSSLSAAIRVVQVYYAENGTYQGFDPATAARYDPSIVYTQGAPAPGTVAIRVTPSSVVLVMLVDGSGYLCAAAGADVVTFGRANAPSPDRCTGGW
jgi:hypothetical protein